MPPLRRKPTTLLHVREVGAGLPVVLLHPFPLHGRTWTPQLEALSGRARLLAVDAPGCGLSPLLPEPPRSLDDYAREVLAAVDARGVESVVLVGIGFGGQIALRLVEHLGARLLGVLLSGTDPGAEREPIASRCHELAAEVERSGVDVAADEFLPKLLGGTTLRTRPALLEELRGLIRENTPAGLGAALRAMAARPDATGLLARLRCPTLCVAGEDDAHTSPALVRATAERVVGGRSVVVPAAGHLPNLEAPEAFNEALEELLIECSPAGARPRTARATPARPRRAPGRVRAPGPPRSRRA